MSRTLDKWPAPARSGHRMMPVAGRTGVIGLLVLSLSSMRDIVGLTHTCVTIIVTIGSFLCIAGFLAMVVEWSLEYRLIFRVRNFMRRGGAICFECGYRIDNLAPTSECCPECGYSIAKSKLRTEEWVAKSLKSGFLLLPLLEPREHEDEEDPM